MQLGAEADEARIAALEAAARALCPEAEVSAESRGAEHVRASWSPSDEAEDTAGDDPLPEQPPDG